MTFINSSRQIFKKVTFQKIFAAPWLALAGNGYAMIATGKAQQVSVEVNGNYFPWGNHVLPVLEHILKNRIHLMSNCAFGSASYSAASRLR